MNALIVDDEPLACERMRALLQELPDVDIAGTAQDGPQALALAVRLKPQVLLLDVRMPGMNGLEVARHLALLDEPPAIIFTTAYDEYAMRAFEAQAVGYLLKPVRKEKLAAALERARRLTRRQIEGITPAPGNGASRRTHLSVRMRDELKLLRVADIVYFAADNKYTTVRHAHGTDLIEDPLRALEEEFAPAFLRIHRNSLVRADRIEAIERVEDGYVVRMRGVAERLPVSRRLAGEIKERLGL